MIDWMFRSRTTGRITIAQIPNLSLALFLATSIATWLLEPAGAVNTGLLAVRICALIWWAVDELVRGVNPWRRILGGGVLVWQLISLMSA
jgi:hypothetical protein